MIRDFLSDVRYCRCSGPNDARREPEPGPAFRVPRPVAGQGLHGRRRPDARAGHRRHDGDVRAHSGSAPAAASGARTGQADRRLEGGAHFGLRALPVRQHRDRVGRRQPAGFSRTLPASRGMASGARSSSTTASRVTRTSHWSRAASSTCSASSRSWVARSRPPTKSTGRRTCS